MALPSLPRTQDAAQPRVDAAVPRSDEDTPAPVRTIVIDPGHGGDDIGARGTAGFEEKRLTLEVALRLRAMLETRLSMRVVLTREDDRAIPPDERAGRANAANGDLLLSLHANAAPTTSISGAEVYYSALEPASSGLPPAAQGPLTLLPWEEAQARQFDSSAQAAAVVQEELQRLVPMSPQSIRQAPLRMLRGASMPAVLVEMLFLTNPEQEQAAGTAEFKDMLATALTTAVSRFEALMDSPLLP
jgi:N-acetylmuramoyl-L-alanine amidase